ncbi:MAG: VIT family protein [Candidatus Sungbacteria bacterium]|uniref:VIT family protein n=1 Tax=Candidatus Sungiibacteriota bacterium TaxID=2750080 RepID=A0A932QZP0_9BACT|nr:VIT family protein [Candidatus Sungbacteria bacterium]
MKLPNGTHREWHVKGAAAQMNWLRAAVLGANDGIISLAALIVGVASVVSSVSHILVTGIAGLLAGALSMAVGEYVSVSSQRDSEKSLLEKERYELAHYPREEFKELVGLYEKKGLSKETAQVVAKELTDHDVFAAHAEAELGINAQELTNPWYAAAASAGSFTAGAVVPLAAIMFAPTALRIPMTFGAVFVALLITGIVSAKVSGAHTGIATLRVLAGGILAMLITFGIGSFFGASV